MAMLGLLLFLLGALLPAHADMPQLLTDPFLQLPTANSVRVVWFTEFAGDHHIVAYGKGLKHQTFATTTVLTRLREDADSWVGASGKAGDRYPTPTPRPIWRHEAEIKPLKPGERVPYRVISETKQGQRVTSQVFSLAASPPAGQPLKILLTSDHQLKPMVAANLQQVAATVGPVDAVFFAGDLVNVPDRASEWFDDNRGGAFFPALQGRANYGLEQQGNTTHYHGAPILQFAPIFPAIGNHEVMGRFSLTADLNSQFSDAIPRWAAAKIYQPQPGQSDTPPHQWLQDNSFNTITYEEIFSLPASPEGGKTFYAVTVGDVRLVVLYATNVWRNPSLTDNTRGKYRERQADLDNPAKWGYGQHIFEPITPGSRQYEWLKQELASPAFRQARYKIVMLHHPPHSLGDNIVPAYTDPVPRMQHDRDGNLQAVQYEYPLEQDYLIRDVMPLLEQAGVQLVLFGHSHLWNRFVSPQGMHFLETSNVGNSYGAAWGEKRRPVPEDYKETYVAVGDPNGLAPVVPSITPLLSPETGDPLPYIASNSITVFSILDTATGSISSYRFDTRTPEQPAIKFDEFVLNREKLGGKTA